MDIRQFDGYETIRLHTKESELLLDPKHGMTVVSFKVRGTECIFYDPERKEEGKTYGIPLLFSTPNRIKNNRYTFEGREYQGEMHGFARLMPFHIEKATVQSVTGTMEFSPKFPLFPFSSVLSLTITLTGTDIRWDYSLENKGDKDIPFGIALHPFFLKQGKTHFATTATLAMETDATMLPTGAVHPVDYQLPTDADTAHLDTVFCNPDNNVITCLSSGTFLFTISGSPEFRHVVIYTPEGKPFVCIEPQSCSTDCVNLDAKAGRKLSGLQVVRPGETAKGFMMIFATTCSHGISRP
jgi:aldose 1-epimerase